MRIFCLIAFCLAGAASAQQGLRAGDMVYTEAEMTALLSDHAVEFFDGSVSRYRGDGAYSYKYTENDRPWLGTWEATADSEVCLDFPNGSRRCDTFVSDGTRLVMITADGTRFPVRTHRALIDGE